ncbi:kinase-like domain-containing protein [Hypomontagnella monticulosa]|nr:kinase-like domain-containing protein [Hypomontagnella monticulosa]
MEFDDRSYGTRHQHDNEYFHHYRTYGSTSEMPRDPEWYRNRPVYPNKSPFILFNVAQRAEYDLVQQEPVESTVRESIAQAWDRAMNTDAGLRAQVKNLRDQFDDSHPVYEFRKVLGEGGCGLVAHYRIHIKAKLEDAEYDKDDPWVYDVVIKFPANISRTPNIRNEEYLTRKVRQSAHCVQTIEKRRIGKKVDDDFEAAPRQYDSSDSRPSSGDESTTQKMIDDRNEILARRRQRRAEKRSFVRKRPKPQHEGFMFTVLEYMENGTLWGLIAKLAEDRERNPEKGGRTPNRVLWSFWLCLIRACIALEYPPRKFHRGRRRDEDAVPLKFLTPDVLAAGSYRLPENDLIETIPKGLGAQRRMNMVHFDVDPSNIFIDGLELAPYDVTDWHESRKEFDNPETGVSPLRQLVHLPTRDDRHGTEHELVPRLKLADFDAAQIVKSDKSNQYYLDMRLRGKAGYMAPEQFGREWEYKDILDAGEYGDEIANSNVAGSFGPHTNIWGIASSMWSLITGFQPAKPPQPQVPPGLDIPDGLNPEELENELRRKLVGDKKNTPISYCSMLLGPTDAYEWVDKDLRQRIYECMYHRPQDRPTLSALLDEALYKNSPVIFPEETDEDIRRWVNRWIYAPGKSAIETLREILDNHPPGGDPDAARTGNPKDEELYKTNFPNGFIAFSPTAAEEEDYEDPIDEGASAVSIRRRKCALIALRDSFRHQAGVFPLHARNSLPDYAYLRDAMVWLRVNGMFAEHFGEIDALDSNEPPIPGTCFQEDILAGVAMVWGADHHLNIELGVDSDLGFAYTTKDLGNFEDNWPRLSVWLRATSEGNDHVWGAMKPK